MIKSMTGYGKKEGIWRGQSIVVEARAVNHRFREVVIRLPKGLSMLEAELKEHVYSRCLRGRVDLIVSWTGSQETEKLLKFDRQIARQYLRVFKDLKQEFKLGGSVDVALLAGCREVVAVSEFTRHDPRIAPLIKRLVGSALLELNAMRKREGKALLADMKLRLREFRCELDKIRRRAPEVSQGLFLRMKDRVGKLLGNGHVDANRLNQELAVYADRCDVTEEMTRLESHLAQFEMMLKSRESVGRQLDFLVQEMGREVNTIGSKANDTEISVQVVRLKSELEKIREQVQNIE